MKEIHPQHYCLPASVTSADYSAPASAGHDTYKAPNMPRQDCETCQQKNGETSTGASQRHSLKTQ